MAFSSPTPLEPSYFSFSQYTSKDMHPPPSHTYRIFSPLIMPNSLGRVPESLLAYTALHDRARKHMARDIQPIHHMDASKKMVKANLSEEQ